MATTRSRKVKVVTQNGGADTKAPGELEERIRARAFEIYRARLISSQPGDAVSDWLAAEREICPPAHVHVKSPRAHEAARTPPGW
jgi:hypothetical protein